MPHKFNAERRDKFSAAKNRVANWSGYNEALRSRGDLSIWFSADAVAKWSAPRRQDRGGQATYSDLAIEVCLMLRLVFHQPRWKTVIGDALKSRKIDTQIAEVQIGAKALNRMTSLGRAVFEPV